jgi:hypothetical protein
MPIRDEFPPSGSDYLDGTSDGLVYTTIFAGSNLEATYAMVRNFLKEEGYQDLPLPADAQELLQFRLPTRNKQILLFEDNGYVHNPIKVLFPADSRTRRKLILKIYNEKAEQHLLRFHNRLED